MKKTFHHLRFRIAGAVALIGVVGVPRFLLFTFVYFLSSLRIWEFLTVKKVRNSKLARAIRGLPDYRCDDLVSVILPVNNGRSKGVERLVTSLKAQTHKNIEFIAVDSGSTDDTVPWLRSQEFKVIEIPPADFSHAYSRNTGASHANGKYLLFVVDDAIFTDPDWLRSALFLITRFRGDSLSSRQTIDENADAYARLLDTFLSLAQSDRLSVNISRNSFVATLLRRYFPLKAYFRSVSIDDTNHLVRSEVFERIRFEALTVEDIDFARRLTLRGGRVIYTNLLSIVHYHSYNEHNLRKYARRVFLDTKVISQWQPYLMRLRSREALLIAALHVLALVLRALSLQKQQRRIAIHRAPGAIAATQTFMVELGRRIGHGSVTDMLGYIESVDTTSLKSMKANHEDCFREASEIFSSVLGGAPPSNLYFDEKFTEYLLVRFKADVSAAAGALSRYHWETISQEELKEVCLFLWCNRIMSHLARDEIFRTISLRYDLDRWGIGDWA